MKRVLVCLFTYNRLRLLKNAVRSIDAFFPWGDRLIIDDGSTDDRVRKYLAGIDGVVGWRCAMRERMAGRSYGGYYNNMRYGLEYALENGYDYSFFFEDDQQMVWSKSDYLEYMENVFTHCPDAIQIQPLFFRRILSYGSSVEYIENVRAYRSDRGFTTSGIWNLAAVRRYPDYRFICTNGDDLPANSAYWMRRGYRVYLQFDPTVAIVPWVQSRSFKDSNSDDHANSVAESNFILKPLDEQEINLLQTRPPALPAYQEYFNLSKENTAGPIWHQRGQNLNRFYFLCRKVIEEEDRIGMSPIPIPMLDSWEPTRIPPLESHLEWDPGRVVDSRVPAWKRYIPKAVGTLRTRLMHRGMLSPRDYFGYMGLRRRLRREQQALAIQAPAIERAPMESAR